MCFSLFFLHTHTHKHTHWFPCLQSWDFVVVVLRVQSQPGFFFFCWDMDTQALFKDLGVVYLYFKGVSGSVHWLKDRAAGLYGQRLSADCCMFKKTSEENCSNTLFSLPKCTQTGFSAFQANNVCRVFTLHWYWWCDRWIQKKIWNRDIIECRCPALWIFCGWTTSESHYCYCNWYKWWSELWKQHSL